MDQDIDYSDLIEDSPKGKKEKPKQRAQNRVSSKALRLILVILLLVIVLGAGGYFALSRPELLQFLAQLRPAASPAATATVTPEPPQPTEPAMVAVSNDITPTPSEVSPTEAPLDAAPEALLPLAEIGALLQTSAQPGDQQEQAGNLARNMAVREPYTWEYLEFQPGTLVKDVERYYIDLLNKEMGFLMSFNERYPGSGLAVFKFKQDTRRVTIQYFEGNQDQAPTAFIFYENW